LQRQATTVRLSTQIDSLRCAEFCADDTSADVQPALKSDGWDTDPFVLTPSPTGNGALLGRGASDDKGPLLGWLNVISAHVALGKELPVNLKMCFEGMEESGSEGLDDLIERQKGAYFKDVDAVCISFVLPPLSRPSAKAEVFLV
jgi:acetylornithine deacetylase/succinyl-diaminopimelate desuccinylase-like protein